MIPRFTFTFGHKDPNRYLPLIYILCKLSLLTIGMPVLCTYTHCTYSVFLKKNQLSVQFPSVDVCTEYRATFQEENWIFSGIICIRFPVISVTFYFILFRNAQGNMEIFSEK